MIETYLEQKDPFLRNLSIKHAWSILPLCKLRGRGSYEQWNTLPNHLSFFFNFILFLNFTILYWFCQISKWICHRYTCVPHPEHSSLRPPHTIPLGHPSAPAPSIQYRASNLVWWLVSYMILYVLHFEFLCFILCYKPRNHNVLSEFSTRIIRNTRYKTT